MQLGAVTGFERLLLCDKQGQVMAGNKDGTPGLPAMPGNIARLIADRDAEAVPLVGDEEASLLSRAAHLAPDDERMANLAEHDVAAAMFLPLHIDGELVASLQAYHSSPRRCGAERRAVAHLFAERLVARMARQGWKA